MYTVAGISSAVLEASSSGETKLDGTRLGTAFGIGLVSFEPDLTNSVGWFLYIGVNIRWNDFDNRKKDPYKNFLSRWSVLVAIAYTNDIYYNGQRLNDTHLGFKPVIGINFEPIKHLDIGAGMISFIPDNTSIQNMPVIRPYVSLSFDFNLFNYLIQKR
jgi:hypothetical protein